ncbi:hypothetical protein LZ009_05040 [Ramlibacter sp. XY19]|uniref:hypothetical protein n=1 Tax=Ramlibacter paludis TaxID=2908000 RepID=UPI0023DAAFC9|nr:hypothetical protein [Ramlibacter paludis]MCG2592141.1 hypothetical protein [Ramlibacter paludis]
MLRADAGRAREPRAVHHLASFPLASISELIAEKRGSPELPTLRARVAALPQASTATLVARLETTADPLMLWALHLELDRRDLPPALRWPANDTDEQTLYVTWSADLYWFCRRHPEHRTRFRGWQGLFKQPPASHGWHATARRNFVYVQPRYSLAHWCSKGLALEDADRATLMTMPTNQMRADRRALERRKFVELERQLLDAASQKPDKAQRHPAHEVAARRAAMLRTFVLSGRSYAKGSHHWSMLAGEQVTRQGFTKQVRAAQEALRLAALPP